MLEIIILLVFGFIWILLALIQDIKKREIDSWINYSLIIFILGFRFFYTLFSGESFSEINFFYNGLIGLAIFFVLGNALYYSRFFAGGDYRLFVALGTILPIYSLISSNFKIMLLFLACFFAAGFIYLLISIFVLSIKNFINFKKSFKKEFIIHKRFLILMTLLGIIFLILGFFSKPFFILALFCLLIAYLLVYVKAVDNSCMVKSVFSGNLTEGDWLHSDIKIGKKLIKANWSGLTKEEIKIIQLHKKKILIRFGVAFAPVFLIAFLLWIILIKTGLMNFWIF
ncbi:MAG: prepilin peptidase [Candidatus Pacearchaeota archaeon]|jgi:hypothetical protein